MQKFITITLFIALGLFALASVLDIISIPPETNTQSTVGEANKDVPQNNNSSGFSKLLKSAISENEFLHGEEKNQINFLFLGIGGEEHASGNYLTDTIIIGIFVPKSKRAALISIPRDLLVRSRKKEYFTKINALYAADIVRSDFPGPMGIEFTKEKITEITGLAPDYYAVLDLAGVEKIVDTVGGIYLRRDQDLMDDRFPDNNYGYEIYKVNEGWRYLSGKEAVKYIRTRHTAGGDFDRMKRQQEIARAIKKKIEGLKSVSGLPKLLSLYKTLKDHLATDLKLGEISRFLEISEGIKEEDVIFERVTAETNGLLVYDRIELGGALASVLKPRAGLEEYGEIKAKINEVIAKLNGKQ